MSKLIEDHLKMETDLPDLNLIKLLERSVSQISRLEKISIYTLQKTSKILKALT
jgi:hypothetical protein